MDKLDLFRLFSAEAAAGVIALLPLVSLETVGRSFYKINARVALAFMALALITTARWSGLDLWASIAGGLGLVIGLSYLRLLGTREYFQRAHPALIAVILLFVASLVLQLIPLIGRIERGPFWTWLAFPSALNGAALIGAVALSMILGHYYLNYPKLPIDPLKRYTIALMAASFLRLALFVTALVAIEVLEVPGSKPDRSFWLDETLTLLPRGLFGIAGPCLLAVMSWGTVKIKSTQSATGILYGAMIFVASGELLAAWFLTRLGLAI